MFLIQIIHTAPVRALKSSANQKINTFYFRYTMQLRRHSNILLVAEHNNYKVSPITRNALTACKKITGEINVLVAGEQCQTVSKTLSESNGIAKILQADDAAFKNHMAENVMLLVEHLQKKHNFTHILAGNSSFSRALIPRLASKLNMSSLSDVIAIKSSDTFSRYVYSSSAIQTSKLKDPVKILTIRGTSFEADSSRGGAAKIESIVGHNFVYPSVNVLSRELIKYKRPQLEDARIVVSGGRGLRSKDNFKIIYELADKLQAAVGCTRAVVDAGFAPNDYQIGQSGKVIAPSLYIAVGISGAVQHVAGIRDCKVIVAINKDPGAPIFKIADYGIVGDLFAIVPKLISKL